MREIKFRFWDIDWKKYYYMELWNDRSGDTFPSKNSPQGKLKHPQQFTGLKDKNGKEIYEGDVLAWEGSKGDVTFSQGSFRVLDTTSIADRYRPISVYDLETAEIIGNIYENPELIK